ncbi:30S ribosomal protein S18 [Patescibacteria group bacterium]|nr:30S ribosomal protein S18 [Patescibacteria group bacterium]
MAKRIVKKKIRRSNKPCGYCKAKTEPNYKEVEGLKVGLSNKMRIVARVYSGLCLKHQRRLTREIKKARHMALIPFVQKV